MTYSVKSIDCIIVTRKKEGRLVEAESGNEVVAVISNDEVILHDEYEIKVVPAGLDN